MSIALEISELNRKYDFKIQMQKKALAPLCIHSAFTWVVLWKFSELVKVEEP